jgi:catechol 2,3-dioxygenase-like lactoylglutathione lyase family enzyme
MKRLWTIIGVDDVARSMKWYQTLLGQPVRAPAHDYFGQIRADDGSVLLSFHQWGIEEHPPLLQSARVAAGSGLLLFFCVDNFPAALQRVHALGLRLEQEPHLNDNTHAQEFSLRDPDGYYVTISAYPGL